MEKFHKGWVMGRLVLGESRTPGRSRGPEFHQHWVLDGGTFTT
jgi:hypothetical protein